MKPSAPSSRPHGRKILLLGAFAPSLVWFRGPLIADLIAAGHSVIAAAGEMDDATARELRAIGAEPVDLPVARTSMNPLGDLGYMQRIRRVLRKYRPDVLITYTAKPNVWGALAARGQEPPVVVAMVTGLGFAFTEGPGRRRMLARGVLELLYRIGLRRCRHVLFQNPDDRESFVSKGFVHQEKTHITNGSGVDLARFTQQPVPENPCFLMVARLLGDKGVREYAEAAIRLKRRYPGASFRLAGWIDGGPSSVREDELQRWIADGLEYLGRVSDVRPALREASVYVLPSYREGTPRSVLEAMGVGRAIVTTDAVGCRETVEPGSNGFLAPVRDVDALADAMERFIVDPELARRMGEASRRLAERKYDVHAVNRDLMSVVGL